MPDDLRDEHARASPALAVDLDALDVVVDSAARARRRLLGDSGRR